MKGPSGRSLTLTPALAVTTGSHPALNGDLTWQWREDGHVTDAWTVHLAMGPLTEEAPAWPERTIDADSMDPGFDAENVYVTFGADGELSVVERYYVPWQ